MPTGPDVTPVLFGFVGRSGAGKTTLITDVIDCLRLDGFTVSAMLHEYLSEPEPDPRALAQRMAGVDIVLFEGFGTPRCRCWKYSVRRSAVRCCGRFALR